MKSRCLNKNVRAYAKYGAIGITVCDKWLTFSGFLEDMGVKPEGYTLDRIDGSKGYYKENCRWATYEEQNNNRSFNRYIEFKGKRQTLTEWSRELDIPINTISMRLDHYGWPLERALSKK